MRTTYACLASVCLLLASCEPSREMKPHCPAGCINCRMDATCADCTPNQTMCRGATVIACNMDGTLGGIVKTCDADHSETCQDGQCLSPCDVAASTHSYIGCDYWPTPTLNSQLNPEFDFAVAVANPIVVGDVVQGAPAEITITLGGLPVRGYDKKLVQPGEVVAFPLDWIPEVSQNQSSPSSILTSDGAYHLTSSLPVTVYQFNPLQYERPQTNTCKDQNPINNMCHSYTNDASILLPSTALLNEYIVLSRGGFTVTDYQNKTSSIPGFFTVVGTQDNTVVTVDYTAYAPDPVNEDAVPGTTAKYTLDKGTVLEVITRMDTAPCVATSMNQLSRSKHCDLGPDHDLTGTHITADKPIAVFGGHACAFVPYDKWACDHMEEMLFPLNTWGQTVAVAQTQPATQGEVNYWRVVAGSANNDITFEPATVHKPITLDKAGQFIDFPAQGGFIVKGTGRVAVVQYMVGENATMDFGVDVGDPSMGLGIPIEQYRLNYDFLTPETYTKNTLTIIAPIEIDGTKVDPTFMLDGMAFATLFIPIGMFPVEITDQDNNKHMVQYGYMYVDMKAGAHHITANQKFGITVSGIANFTSYLYAGGLNLNEIMLQ